MCIRDRYATVTADLIDDHTLILTGDDLIEVYNTVVVAIRYASGSVNGGANLRPSWLPKLRRGASVARSMSHVRHDSVTLPPDEPESAQNQTRVIKIAKVAEILGVDVRTVYRWIKTDLALAATIIPGDLLRFDQELVEAYAAAHPRSRSRDVPDHSTTQRANTTQRPV